ncbi:MAG: ABC transporter ATP-binding protein [Rhodospirillaceae bacterium]
MIHLIDVSKTYRNKNDVKVVLLPTTLSLPTNRAIGVLGRNGAGKSTLLRLLAGIERPDTGDIRREARLSWPLGFAGGFHADLSGRENVAFIADIHNVPPAEIMPFVLEFSELGSYFEEPFRTYSSGMRARLAFAASMAVDFDCYLIDEITAVGDRRFQEKCRDEFARRRERSGLLLISHSANTIRQYCDLALVLRDGMLVPFDNVGEAIQFYEND